VKIICSGLTPCAAATATRIISMCWENFTTQDEGDNCHVWSRKTQMRMNVVITLWGSLMKYQTTAFTMSSSY
jgi:hypothetical protein